ncbi:MAG: DNA alkylation repair protein [Paramuribaculum sp.]|nr:DNA alkylation repair protein [Paramuribaculum sp.]
MTMTQFNDIQLIKRRLYAMRNGITAQTLRTAGSPHRLIMGVNLPQLVEIAQTTQPNALLARKLWGDINTRESMLLAPMIFPTEEMTFEEASQWLETTIGTEATDILCHRLLRKLPFAYKLAIKYADSENPLWRYASLRILWHFISVYPQDIQAIAQRELANSEPLTKKLAAQTISEIEFYI